MSCCEMRIILAIRVKVPYRIGFLFYFSSVKPHNIYYMLNIQIKEVFLV